MKREYSDREVRLCQVSKKVLTQIWKERLAVIEEDYRTNSVKYEEDFNGKMEKLLLQWENMYEAAKDLKYIVISPLNSSVITKTYELQIALFGEELYADVNPLCFYWVPEFIYRDVEKDMNLYKEKVSREIIRIRKDEVNEMRRRYVLCHAYISMYLMDKMMKKAAELPVFKRISKEDTKILYGTYMEQMAEIRKE